MNEMYAQIWQFSLSVVVRAQKSSFKLWVKNSRSNNLRSNNTTNHLWSKNLCKFQLFWCQTMHWRHYSLTTCRVDWVKARHMMALTCDRFSFGNLFICNNRSRVYEGILRRRDEGIITSGIQNTIESQASSLPQ